MSILSKIESEIAGLPAHLRAEVLDFVQFVKHRHGLPSATSGTISGAEEAPLFQVLASAGLVGCVETDQQLSTNYKAQLDYSAKQHTSK